MKQLANWIKNFAAQEEGVTMVEYGLIAALIAIVSIVALTGTGLSIKAAFTKVCTTLYAALGTAGTCA